MVRFLLALCAGKIVFKLVKMFKLGSGTSLAGLLVLKIYPDFLKEAKKYVTGAKISITGTNGKTTTSGLISCIFEQNGRKIINNSEGANMLTGVVNAFVQKLWPGRIFNNCIIESDEAYLTRLYDYMEFDSLLVTNLSRDQLDRYGELDTVALKIKEAVLKNPNLKLFINADDPLLTEVFNENAIYYGFEKGDYKADLTLHEDCMEITLNGNTFKINLLGAYNGYNALAAIVTGLEYGFSPEQIQAALDNYKGAFGRCQKVCLKGKEVLIHLIKNPAGTTEVLKTITPGANLLIAINDNYADGCDVSWLWDAQFEYLADAQNIITSGKRAHDMALRLKYAGVKNIIVNKNLKDAIKQADIILCTYTVLLEIKKLHKG
jgi:UDP-N-acetylmuramyl tripeptide synthase